MLASASFDGTINFFDYTDNFKYVNKVIVNNIHQKSICFSPTTKYEQSSKFFASILLNSIKIYNTETFQELSILHGHTCIINSICFSPHTRIS